MKKYLLLPVGVVWLLAALSQSLLAADRQLVFLSDQLRARTARLIRRPWNVVRPAASPLSADACEHAQDYP